MIKSINEILKHILSEDLTSLKNQYYKDMDDAKFQELVALDPTYRGGQQAGNYARWILNMYLKGTLKEEDFYKVTENLEKFDRLKRQLQNKDIFQFKDIPSLAQALEAVEPQELSARQQQRQSKKQGLKDAELVYEDNDWEVYIPKSYEASCALGSGTSWCTATGKTDRYYNQYSEQGELYIIISKHDPSEKYQFHFESNQFMNGHDKPIPLKSFLDKNKGLDKFFKSQGKENKEFHINDYAPEDVTYEIFLNSKFKNNRFIGNTVGQSEMILDFDDFDYSIRILGKWVDVLEKIAQQDCIVEKLGEGIYKLLGNYQLNDSYGEIMNEANYKYFEEIHDFYTEYLQSYYDSEHNKFYTPTNTDTMWEDFSYFLSEKADDVELQDALEDSMESYWYYEKDYYTYEVAPELHKDKIDLKGYRDSIVNRTRQILRDQIDKNNNQLKLPLENFSKIMAICSICEADNTFLDAVVDNVAKSTSDIVGGAVTGALRATGLSPLAGVSTKAGEIASAYIQDLFKNKKDITNKVRQNQYLYKDDYRGYESGNFGYDRDLVKDKFTPLELTKIKGLIYPSFDRFGYRVKFVGKREANDDYLFLIFKKGSSVPIRDGRQNPVYYPYPYDVFQTITKKEDSDVASYNLLKLFELPVEEI